jgi:hypothetical protein
MIDWLYILILVLGALLLVIQELTIRSQRKTIDIQDRTLRECEPVIRAVAKAIEEAKAKGSDKAKVDL